jgi:hypothetical protein
MSKQVSIRFAVIMGVLLALALVSFAAPMNQSSAARDEGNLQPRLMRGSGSLDNEPNELRYVKTTDYGATWTLAQAGDLSAFAPIETGLPDFGAVVMANGELCYVVPLPTAATPGVYSMSGPNFTPVLIMAEGANSFEYGYGAIPGHANVSRAPNGNLICTIWGANSTGANTVWAAKSTNNGTSWGTPWVAATEPALPPIVADYDGLFKMPDRSHNDYTWCQYQIQGTDGYDQYVLVIPHNPGATGTVVAVGNYAVSGMSYMFGGCKPIAYDPVANWLYVTFYNYDRSGMFIYGSDDMGMTWQLQNNLPFPGIRYPSIAMRTADGIPWAVGSLVPGDEQCMFAAYDEFGYNGGSWSDITETYCTILSDEATAGYNSLYFAQMWWWDANRGMQTVTGYTNFLVGEIIHTLRTTDGGASWIDFGTRAHYLTNEFVAGTMQPSDLAGGENGLAYVVFSASPGITDEVAPTVTQLQLLSPATDPDGPYVVRAFYDDNVGIDISDPAGAGPWVNWGPSPDSTTAFVNQDSVQLTAPERNAGWYYFTIPDTAFGGFGQGDSIYFYCDGYDQGGTYAASDVQLIVAGVGWFLDTPERVNNTPSEFQLLGNYPNPFNPSTRIEFTIPSATNIDLKIYNTLGQEVAVLADNLRIDAGRYAYTFDAGNLPSGVYIYRLTAGSISDSKKMILVK